ncbi:MAG: sporulation protein YabP [Eubacteriales bacterium]|nr:sporulation protein YabP [Eubacteriales bacterium]
MQDKDNLSSHEFTLTGRSNLTLSGIIDVLGFDEETVSMETEMGNLVVKGENLRMSQLSLESGRVAVEGKINSMQYLGNTGKKSVFGKIFR